MSFFAGDENRDWNMCNSLLGYTVYYLLMPAWMPHGLTKSCRTKKHW